MELNCVAGIVYRLDVWYIGVRLSAQPGDISTFGNIHTGSMLQ